jgi:hypothetical protein
MFRAQLVPYVLSFFLRFLRWEGHSTPSRLQALPNTDPLDSPIASAAASFVVYIRATGSSWAAVNRLTNI